jgi:hypothetical protein
MDLGDLMRNGGETVVIVIALLVVTSFAVWRFERSVERHGRPGGSSMGDAFGNLIDVFDPAQARASRDLKEQQNVGPVSKTPERDPDDPIQITLGPDGEPRSVRIRRSR